MPLPKGLYVFVEGPDDDRFVRAIFNRVFEADYAWIETYQYATKTQRQVCNFIKSIERMNADYIFLTDLDLAPCITFRKERAGQKYVDLTQSEIVVVRTEIEGWYLAGLDQAMKEAWGISDLGHTNTVTKEQFNQMIPRNFLSRIDFMQAILKQYAVEVAQKQNASFRYFIKKYSS